MAASFYGNVKMIAYLLNIGVDINAYIDSDSGFHSHASALHHAVFSGSLDSVKLLVGAGANLHLVDRIYEGTPLGWAKYLQTVEPDPVKIREYAEIESYLLSL